MRKLIIGAVFGLLLLSCNDKLWDEIDRLNNVNSVQGYRLSFLTREIDSLNQLISDTEMKLVDLITFSDEVLADQIEENNSLILENLEAIADNLSAIDSLGVDIDNVATDAQTALDDAVELINEEQEALEDLITNNENALADLQQQVDSIQPVINNYTLVSVTNITQVVEEDEDEIVIDDSLCDSDYDEAEDYILPAYHRHWSNKYWAGGADCDSEANSDNLIYEELIFVQFGTDSERIFRTYIPGEGWIGTFGLDENKMDIPGFDGVECRLDETVKSPSTDEIDYPSLGIIAGEEVDSNLKISFEFDNTTGDYIGCINTEAETTWYVNGVAQDSGSFNVGKYNGVYIITAEVGDLIIQHSVERDIDSKNVKTYGTVGKAKKKVIV